MGGVFREYKALDLPRIAREVSDFWDRNDVFDKSISSKKEENSFVFFEGPPSANGLPGIHHVMSRTIKDLFCRYKTLKGFRVNRKAGWDTHGLPVELSVEKELGITKEDIGVKISVEDYNKSCRDTVMRYTDVWNKLTKDIGYWVNMQDPYTTYENKYIESVWWLLANMYKKGLLYKGYTIQPYSPKAGTGLSSHEINQPGCYRDITDSTVVAQFKATKGTFTKVLDGIKDEVYFLAWTTTPWTLPSNTALAVGPEIDYVLVKTYNQYTFRPIQVILAENLVCKQLTGRYKHVENEEEIEQYAKGNKYIPYRIDRKFKGSDILGIRYEQLLPYAQPHKNPEKAFIVIGGDFVTTQEGTGVVHIAPTFGADDAKVAKDTGVPSMLVLDKNGNPVPLVDLQGKFIDQMGKLSGKYVKNEYYDDGNAPKKSADVEIIIDLKTNNKAFKAEKYVHSYPHCWRTDRPVLYYPLDSWFIRSTAAKDKLIELNKTINWKPESTGTRRFGNWLENLNDWNLSRSRYWGIPLPIWRTKDGTEEKVIGSIKDLQIEISKSTEKGFMRQSPLEGFNPEDMSDENYSQFDLHKSYVDDIVLVSSKGEPMKREEDLIDVWFDSGAMPFAQWHYPFENKENIDHHKLFPADFIAEGVDQTRGWFFTLHAIATMNFGSVAYKNVVSNGLVLDKNGQKMSKRLDNAIDPFETLKTYGPDATRWYMILNSQPWDNLRFDLEGLAETSRKFFGTLYNTYSFFALYANIDKFTYKEDRIPVKQRSEIDRWILSELNVLTQNVDKCLGEYEPTKAVRQITYFVTENLSNWFVRLSRRRFWKGQYAHDKICAYQTLYDCLITVAKLGSPIAPFFMDNLYRDLNNITKKEPFESVHLTDFPKVDTPSIDSGLQNKMSKAQSITSMVLSLRKKQQIRVRQPLQKIMIPVIGEKHKNEIKSVSDLIKSEVNVKQIEFINDTSEILVKKIKPNFEILGPKYGEKMGVVASHINKFDRQQISDIERNGSVKVVINGENVLISVDEVKILSQDIEGWLVASSNGLTVALDIKISDELRYEGIARELVNRIQNMRKNKGFEVTDKINLVIHRDNLMSQTVESNRAYICGETLAIDLTLADSLSEGTDVELGEVKTKILITKL